MENKQPSTVYFCPRITADNLVNIYRQLGREATGRVCAKLSTGEAGNPNHLRCGRNKKAYPYDRRDNCGVRHCI